MADTVDIVYIYPPNYDTASPVPIQRRFVVLLTGASDGTGESAVVKVDKSALRNHLNVAPTSIVIEKIQYDVNGHNYVTLLFDHTTDEVIADLKGEGELDWSKSGGRTDAGTGGAGDILLTTDGAADGASYAITLHCRLK